jgi:hypothetical protein
MLAKDTVLIVNLIYSCTGNRCSKRRKDREPVERLAQGLVGTGRPQCRPPVTTGICQSRRHAAGACADSDNRPCKKEIIARRIVRRDSLLARKESTGTAPLPGTALNLTTKEVARLNQNYLASAHVMTWLNQGGQQCLLNPKP